MRHGGEPFVTLLPIYLPNCVCFKDEKSCWTFITISVHGSMEVQNKQIVHLMKHLRKCNQRLITFFHLHIKKWQNETGWLQIKKNNRQLSFQTNATPSD